LQSVHSLGTFAALDLGTTNCRLLIAHADKRFPLRIVDSFSRIVRLGEGLDAHGVLSAPAMDRTIQALAVCAGKIRRGGVTQARLVATEACRRATNCVPFVAMVRQATGLELEIIPSAEEARLVLAGCAPLLANQAGHALVFDIGGGSTEVLFVETRPQRTGVPATVIKGVMSIPYGVVSLTERFGNHTDEGQMFAAMVTLVRSYLTAFDADWQITREVAEGRVQMLGSSGTVTTLAAIELGLSRYDRTRVDGVSLDFAAIERSASLLVENGSAGRMAQPCIGAARADLMIAGCAILTAICRTWPVGRLRVADRGVREGILADLVDAARLRTAAPAPG
jgi:exopolyphosphatase/guanosine-5'-triphosphate,3'-diphosphate pyrophosphatase